MLANDACVGTASTSGVPLNGVLDDIRVYNRALSVAEIQELVRVGGGTEVAAASAATTWSYTQSLDPGLNSFTYVARDGAGNVSLPVIVSTTYDNTAPAEVAITADGKGDGTVVHLDWSTYDEVANGNDIATYKVYRSTSPFTLASQATLIGTVSAGTKKFDATGLARGLAQYFAVVAVDKSQNFLDTVAPLQATPVDIVAPGEVSNIKVTSTDTAVTINWSAPASNAADLASYNVYFDNAAAVSIAVGTTSHQATGLTAATSYPVRITTVDASGNESTGVNSTAVTLLANPANVTAQADNGRVSLNWAASTPTNLVQQYALYVSTASFTSISGMTPRLRVNSATTSAQIAGLTNDTAYYFAVTAINLSGGETQAVTAVTATPVPDRVGPVVSASSFGGTALSDGMTITTSGAFSVTASDPSGISRVVYALDGTTLATDTSGRMPSAANWDLYSTTDGAHSLTITVYDTLDNATALNFNVNVALAAPAAPVIKQPAAPLAVNQTSIVVSGTADKQTEVLLYNNGTQTGNPVAVDAQGAFKATVAIANGVNTLQAAARNRGGVSSLSSGVDVTVDTSIPAAPTGLTAISKTSGRVALSWTASADAAVKGYDLYRATASFSDLAQATKVNSALLSGNSFEDLPANDGDYFYRVVARNALNTPSALSNEVNAVSDRTAPSATITYTPAGAFDTATGRMAPGKVSVRMVLNEALLTDPFLSITPNAGVPMIVRLTRMTDTEYVGSFDITKTTPTGKAYAVFSARDLIGNRGTTINAGATIEIDAAGPEIASVALTPLSPIKNSATTPATVDVTITLGEAVDAGTTPQLSYQFGAATPVAIDNLFQSASLEWRGSFNLPATAGASAVESFKLVYAGQDDLGNVGTRINGTNSFDVYQGNLPALAIPQNLAGKSLSGGKIELSWDAVSGAAAYQLYRQAPGEASLTALGRVSNATQWTDTPGSDGSYKYAVASVRKHNGAEALSGQSNVVTIVADSQAPAAPQGLAATLLGSGIRASWQAPAATTEALTYNLYRSSSTSITSVSGLTPIVSGVTKLETFDTKPSLTDHAYVVTAVDAIGNESQPSNSVYLNFSLLPVGNLKVVQSDLGAPKVSWTHGSASIAGFDIHLGTSDQAMKLNSGLLTSPAYIDGGYSGDERTYTVLAIDTNAAKSPGRTVVLPKLSATLVAGSAPKRGLMNQLEYEVTNGSAHAVDNIQLQVKLGAHAHVTPRFSLATGEMRVVPVIVGGYSDLAALSPLSTTVDVTVPTGELAQIVRTQDIQVGDGKLVADIQTANMTRGSTGEARFSLTNPGAVEVEVVIARSSGNQASNEVRFKLLDADGNVLAAVPFKQALGSNVRTLADGRTVATIAPGATFTSDWMTMTVPSSIGQQGNLRLEIDALHYHPGRTDATTIQGLSSTVAVSLIDTAYACQVQGITPTSSFGDVPVVISGKALDRNGVNAMPSVPLKLYLNVNRFERTIDVFTDSSGAFSYSYQAQPGENGIYTVSCVHPDVLDRPDNGTFTLKQIGVSPTSFSGQLSRNYVQTLPIRVTTTAATTASNVHLVYTAADQPSGQLPAGVNVILPSAVNVAANSSATLNLKLSADNTAASVQDLVLKVFADERGTTPLATVKVHATFLEAKPKLVTTPSFIETGVTTGGSISESVTLENKGLADMRDVAVKLLNSDGTPAPAWVNLASASAIGTLAVGGQSVVDINFTPDSALTPGNYAFNLHVTSSNHPPVDIGLYAAVVQSGQGNVLFKLSDIYTATLDANGNPIQGLAGATVKVQNEQVLSISQTLISDAAGEALFSDLPAGSYKFRASATNHQEVAGRFTIKPGITVSQDLFLDYNLVTVSWSVTPVTIQDRYTVTVNATYETNVPAPVVVIEPGVVNLPPMKPGDVFKGEFTITNHGLIQAEHLKLALPPADGYFSYDILASAVPATLAANQTVVVPYVVTMLKSPDPAATATATGGGCYSYKVGVSGSYDYVCANGTWTKQSIPGFYWYYSDSSTCGGGGNTGGGGTPPPPPSGGGSGFSGGTGYGYGAGTGSAPAYQSLPGLPVCMPDCPDGKCNNPGGTGSGGDH